MAGRPPQPQPAANPGPHAQLAAAAAHQLQELTRPAVAVGIRVCWIDPVVGIDPAALHGIAMDHAVSGGISLV